MPPTAQRADARDWLRAATTRRMLVLLLLVVVVASVCTRLGFWQLDRAGIRGQEAARIEREELMAAPAVPITEVLAPQTAFGAEHFGRRVSLEGRFDPEQQVLVAGRTVGGRDALMVVTAFHVDGGPHDGAIMPVLRGWLRTADRLEAGAAGGTDVTAPPPTARLEIVGVLSDSEAAGESGLPEGFAGGISAGELAGLWGTPMYSAYLVLEEPAQPGGLAPAPSPVDELDVDPNLQSLAYAVEWWAFALFAVVFWVKILRDDVREGRLAQADRARAPLS
ncbi:Cytochrome oxidase assembly protein ShyY1 [Georgenia satyanarayanai]|uniref:SURF1-like protein n=1 Tax=Georgenia satyanarayanai TaxID=860221 RepID=A0A2Y9A6F8_9MICO|nr:SURF1 family protein [Georgenia satyanarayanai]PYG00645.1 cytochrome oxidase assembly protein ShyY1 [Georgenia satyanarayanai]SSA40034.1 Cytochrome oxidase assembly protein ShyY1 [Georgenia satyanarayanai]